MRNAYVFACLACISCGSVVSGPTEVDAGLHYDAAVTHDSAPDVVDAHSPCEAIHPVAGDPCTAPVVACESGSSEFLVCDEYAQCNDGSWFIQKPESALCAADTSVCRGPAPVAGEACTEAAVNGPGCDTAEGDLCYCYTNGSSRTWMCTPHGPGCPSPRPRLGAACDFDANAQCSYAGVDIMVCAAGTWAMRVPE